MSLYYLLSSLPMLTFDAPPGLTADTFLDACRAQLGARDAEAAAALVYGAPSSHPFAAAWYDKEAILRNAVARERAHANGTDATRWLRPTDGCDTLIESLVEDAFQETDPLKKEKALDHARWTAVEEVQGPDPLSVRAIFAYAVKLGILSRASTRRTEHGRTAFDTLTAIPITLNPETQPLPNR